MSYRGSDRLFHAISSEEFKTRVIQLSMGLAELGVQQDTKLLLLSENRPEWHIVDFAAHLLGAVIVPIFPTLIPEQIEYIVNDSKSEFVFVSSKKQLTKIKEIDSKIPDVKQVITFDSEAVAPGSVSLEEILQRGNAGDDESFYPKAASTAKPDSLATIIYTSGTTGVPKGVMLTHRNLVSNMLDCDKMLELTSEDQGLSFLPLSHSFERVVDYLYFYRGMAIIYSSSIENLLSDLKEAKPTIMANVPRFYEKVRATIQAKAQEGGSLRKKIFNWAFSVGAENLDARLNDQTAGPWLKFKYLLAQQLVLRKIQAATGGNIRFFISGGAPLSVEVARFFGAAGLLILEGYGLTETSPAITFNPSTRPKFGSVGKILPHVSVKIADDGEVLARGPNVMIGYLNLPEATAEVLKNGWFYTGDVGFLDDEGYLTITDRKKQLIVTSVGKKVAPQAIEKAVEESIFIEQVLLLGEKRRFISALIVPDFEQLKIYGTKKGLAIDSSPQLVEADWVVSLIEAELDKFQAHFSDYEKIRKFKLLAEPFTIENGQLTPTMKIKRKAVIDKYADAIEQIYAG